MPQHIDTPALATSSPAQSGPPLFKLASHIGKPVEIALLRVDGRYQRIQELAHIKRMIREWNDVLCGNIIVVQRPGEDVYYVLDGQQRVEAARQLGYSHIIAQIIETSDLEYEAWLFTAFNEGAKHLTAMQKYRARLSWGEHVTKAAEDTLNLYGLTGLQTAQNNGITAPQALRSAWGPSVPLSSRWTANEISDELLLQGTATLDWALRAGRQLWIASGGQANHVYSKANLGALIWLRKFARNKRDLDAVAIGELLADLGSGARLHAIVTDSGNAGGGGQEGFGLRLAEWIIRQTGERGALVELSEEHLQQLAVTRHKAEILQRGTEKHLLAA